MKAIRSLPSQEELLRVFDYCPTTGELRWKVRVSQRCRAGTPAGSPAGKSAAEPTAGYKVEYRGASYRAHRIIWKMLYNDEPQEIDHRDRNPLNNRQNNLRSVTTSQNQMNRGVSVVSRSGIKGVFLCRNGKYTAKICINKKSHYLGCFATAEEATDAYASASRKYHGEFGRVDISDRAMRCD